MTECMISAQSEAGMWSNSTTKCAEFSRKSNEFVLCVLWSCKKQKVPRSWLNLISGIWFLIEFRTTWQTQQQQQRSGQVKVWDMSRSCVWDVAQSSIYFTNYHLKRHRILAYNFHIGFYVATKFAADDCQITMIMMATTLSVFNFFAAL